MKDLSYLKGKPIAILGAGGIGKALGADMLLAGQDVIICDLPPFSEKSLANLEKAFSVWGSQINRDGFKREGQVHFNKATTSVEEAVKDASLIMITLPAVGHMNFFKELVPHLRDDMIIHIIPDNYGSLRLRKLMREMGCTAHPIIGGWHTAPMGSRVDMEGDYIMPSTRIVYRAVSLRGASLPSTDQETFLESSKYLACFDSITEGDGVEGGRTVLDIGFTNGNPVLHVPGVIMGAGAIENYGVIYGDNKKDFSIYCHVFSPAVSKVQEAFYEEETAIAEAIGVDLERYDPKVWYSRSNILGPEYMGYDVSIPFDEVYDLAIGTGPFQVDNRYITEDVPIGCHVFHELGKKFGVKTPVIDAMINISCAMLGRDFYAEGLTLEDLDLAHMSKEEMLDYLDNGNYTPAK